MAMRVTGVVVVVIMESMVMAGEADAFHMMVVALLRHTHFGLETEDVGSVFAHAAVHVRIAGQDLLDPFDQGIDHQRMIIEVGRFHELDAGMTAGDCIRRAVDALDEHPGEQEIRKHDDAADS